MMWGASSSRSTTTNMEGSHEIVPVHDLNPTCTGCVRPMLTIIFFHGIGFGKNDEWKEAWTSAPTDKRPEPVFWPQEWLPEDLGDNVQILSLSYDAEILGAHDDVTEIGKNLIRSLVSRDIWKAPIVLVGHSFGGLVLKSLMVEVEKSLRKTVLNALEMKTQKSCESFSKNVKGTVFYGVPHSGGTENFSRYIRSKFQENKNLNDHLPNQSGLLKNLGAFDRQMQQLSVDFSCAVRDDIIIYGFSEGKPLDDKWGILVPIASARELTRNNNYTIEDADHITICKPRDKEHPGYSQLLECLRVCLQMSGHVLPITKFTSTMHLLPEPGKPATRSIVIAFKNYTPYNFQNPAVYFNGGISNFDMPSQIGPEHVGIWHAHTMDGGIFGTFGTCSYYIKEQAKTLYVMWSVPMNRVFYYNWWNATVLNGSEGLNESTFEQMYEKTLGMPDALQAGDGWKCHKNINSFSLRGSMTTNAHATLELEVKLS